MSHPEDTPKFFLDINLGKQVATTLRSAGIDLVTLEEYFSKRTEKKYEARKTPDAVWLKIVSEKKWVVITKDKRIRSIPAERKAIIDNSVRCICLANGNHTARENAERILDNMDQIIRVCKKPGPFICMVYSNTIKEIEL